MLEVLDTVALRHIYQSSEDIASFPVNSIPLFEFPDGDISVVIMTIPALILSNIYILSNKSERWWYCCTGEIGYQSPAECIIIWKWHVKMSGQSKGYRRCETAVYKSNYWFSRMAFWPHSWEEKLADFGVYLRRTIEVEVGRNSGLYNWKKVAQ